MPARKRQPSKRKAEAPANEVDDKKKEKKEKRGEFKLLIINRRILCHSSKFNTL